jgi:hypothetical protein
MNEFDKLCNFIIETMLAGGSSSVLGNPATSPEIGSQGGKFGNAKWNDGDNRIAYKMGKTKRRKLQKIL